MRTTIQLDDEIFKQAKIAASESGRTLTKVIEDSLRETLQRRRSTAARKRVPLPTYKPTVPGTMPGVDLDDSAALLEIMERGDDTD